MGGMEGMKEERGERQSDRAEKRDQHKIKLGRFGVGKVRSSIQNAFFVRFRIVILDAKLHVLPAERIRISRPW